jgi:2',3'-cyclic-nucleotide 2'-phosphodiesterase/3'-nucleotidase
MKKLASLLSVALVLLAFACQTSGTVESIPEYGTVDKAVVEVLADGKAKTVDIISFNDFHAALDEEKTGKSPGAAKFATALLDARAANPNTVFVSAGDSYQGSALSSITRGKVVSEVFKYLGIAASAVGNHEFDWEGAAHFGEWTADGGFPFVASNIYDKATGKPVDWAKPYHVIKVGGHTIAFLGFATKETEYKAKADFVAPFEFKEPAEIAAYWVKYLDENVQPEVIVALTHFPSAADKADAKKAMGMAELFELDALCKVEGIDAVVTGHSHNTVAGFNNGVPVVQGYYNGRTLGKLSITFKDEGGFEIAPSVDEFFKRKNDIAVNADVQAIVDRYMAEYGQALNEVVTTLDKDMPHDKNVNVTPMGKWVCDVIKAKYGVQVVVMNGGGLRKGFVAGPVTVKDFWELMPFDNYVVTAKVSGAALKAIIAHGIDSKDFGNGQFSGVKVTYDPAIADATKIKTIALDDGTAIVDAQLYTFATNDFQFFGGDKYSMIKPAATDIVETYEPVRDTLIEAARKGIVVPSVAGIVSVAK